MTVSEQILTNINTSLFFKEFTYAQNDIFREGGETKELADNVVWLDELLLVYQVKGREISNIKDIESEERWFNKTVAVKAKKQIRDTIELFNKSHKLSVTNERGQTIDVAKASAHQLVKLVIYEPNGNFLESKRKIKFLESSTAGLIHLFQLKDYEMICKYLVTPAELADYLQFREELYLKHSDAVNQRSEDYLLGHFFTTPDTSMINDSYLENIKRIDTGSGYFEVSWILNNFFEKLVLYKNGKATDYHFIIKEIAKLNRHELKAFGERYKETLQNVNLDKFSLPLRFASPRTECGFVFIGLQAEKAPYWENALLNFAETYRYKRKLHKCVGVVMYRDAPYFIINWAYSTGNWQFDAALEEALSNEEEFYENGKVQWLPRYPLKS